MQREIMWPEQDGAVEREMEPGRCWFNGSELVLLSALVAVALADTAPYRPPPPPPPPTYSAPAPSYRAPAPSYNAPQPVSPPKYDFSWNVKDDYSGNDYGHQEGRDGYDTQGSYYVQLPDGRLQEVTYTVNGDSGFVAQVATSCLGRFTQHSFLRSRGFPQGVTNHSRLVAPAASSRLQWLLTLQCESQGHAASFPQPFVSPSSHYNIAFQCLKNNSAFSSPLVTSAPRRSRHHYISGPRGRAATSPRRTSAPDMALKLVLLSALVAVALAERAPYRPPPPPPLPPYSAPAPSYRPPAPSYSAPQPVSPPKYDFSWNVKDDLSGNDYGHQEGRDGYDTQGSYYVQLPDGRLQEVTYTVNGDSGFVAQVSSIFPSISVTNFPPATFNTALPSLTTPQLTTTTITGYTQRIPQRTSRRAHSPHGPPPNNLSKDGSTHTLSIKPPSD
ncbi:hypothetical protein O3P69_014905 [Scylla paramamosain]|uniref:Cuticle protein n=1 Tax=Scylla paramamosain TaxID=85552 RepID=A0AAW0TYC6_SCYPA